MADELVEQEPGSEEKCDSITSRNPRPAAITIGVRWQHGPHNRLRKRRAVPVSIIPERLYPVLLSTGSLLRFRQAIDRIVLEGLDKARRRDGRRRFRNIPYVLCRIDCRAIGVQLAILIIDLENVPIGLRCSKPDLRQLV